MTFRQQLTYGLEYFGLYYGTYKAVVTDNEDPLGLGRIQIHSPQVHGPEAPTVWCFPEALYAGKNHGLWMIPDIGEWVYVRFDHGQADKPVWSGGWWGTGDPSPDMTVKNVVLATAEGLKIVMNRTDKSITISQSDSTSIILTNGKVVINATFEVEVVGTLTASQGLHSGTGATGSFTSGTGDTIIVMDGIITEIV